MTPEDIAYGVSVADAVDRVGNCWTIRLLAGETGVTFADVIDAWLDWTGERTVESGADAVREEEKIRQFILHFCSLKRIPPKFYEDSWMIEADVADPPILILDEATAMFDPQGEAEFLHACRDALKRRTVLLITHRPASLAAADRIVPMEKGADHCGLTRR